MRGEIAIARASRVSAEHVSRRASRVNAARQSLRALPKPARGERISLARGLPRRAEKARIPLDPPARRRPRARRGSAGAERSVSARRHPTSRLVPYRRRERATFSALRMRKNSLRQRVSVCIHVCADERKPRFASQNRCFFLERVRWPCYSSRAYLISCSTSGTLHEAKSSRKVLVPYNSGYRAGCN
jgi:hypothetical protein